MSFRGRSMSNSILADDHPSQAAASTVTFAKFPNLPPGCSSELRVPGLQMSVESRVVARNVSADMLMRGAGRPRGGRHGMQ